MEYWKKDCNFITLALFHLKNSMCISKVYVYFGECSSLCSEVAVAAALQVCSGVEKGLMCPLSI